jgi:DnaJ family protein A protein 2
VIVILQELDHVTFTRNGIDLFVKQKISLVEALCGSTFVIDHLDSRRLAISNPPGQVLYPGKLLPTRGPVIFPL